MSNQKELLESGEVVYIAQSPEQFTTSQTRIEEMERENRELIRLLQRWKALFGVKMRNDHPLMEDTNNKLAQQ